MVLSTEFDECRSPDNGVEPGVEPEVADKIWLVSFMKYDLGFFDED